jgi:alkylresorcinol/alkylpyrone synthase
VTATLTGTGLALPPSMRQEELWAGFFEAHYDGSRLARRAWERAGVVTRHGAVDPRAEDLSRWSTGERMRRFLAEAMPLGKAALTDALAAGGLAPADVDQLIVVSCTGYATPGLDHLLARDLGMRPDTQRLHIGHMGCYAALPALATAADAVRARGQRVAVLSAELTTLHIQPPTDDVEQMVAHALFADAAAAVTVTPDGDGLSFLDLRARTATGHADLMSWDVTDLGFRMRLSPKVPVVLREHVADCVDELLHANGLGRGDVAAWAVHPGGPRIVDVVADRLGIDDASDSRAVLAEHGNCSSATVLLILDRIMRRGDLRSGDPVVAMAFGPGLTLYTALLRAT